MLFELSKGCKDSVDFLALCKDAEDYVRSDEASVKWVIDTLPRSWTQAKSNIAASMKAGLAPSNFKNEYAMRMAKVQNNEAKATLPSETPEREPNVDPKPEGTVVQLADMPMIPDDLTRMVSYLATLTDVGRVKEVRYLTNHAKEVSDNHLKGIKKGQEARKQHAATA